MGHIVRIKKSFQQFNIINYDQIVEYNFLSVMLKNINDLKKQIENRIYKFKSI